MNNIKTQEELRDLEDMKDIAKEIKILSKRQIDEYCNIYEWCVDTQINNKYILKYAFLTRINPKQIVKDNLIPTIFFRLPDDSLCNSRLMLQPKADVKNQDKAYKELATKGLSKYCDLQPSNCGYYFGRAVLFDW